MGRVNTSDVKEIFSTSRTDLEAFISMANEIVDEKLLSAGYTALKLFNIERALTAHLVVFADPQLKSLSMPDGISKSFDTTPLGDGLDATRYGKMVKMLDTQGILANTGKKTASFTVF